MNIRSFLWGSWLRRTTTAVVTAVGLAASLVALGDFLKVPADKRWLVPRDGSALTIEPDSQIESEVVKADMIVFRSGEIVVDAGRFFVANEMKFAPGTSLRADEGSAVRLAATRLIGGRIDTSGRHAGASGSRIFVVAASVAGTSFAAHGANGSPGEDGEPGANGRDGRCTGFGGWRKANPGGDGQPGGNGGNGGDGGVIEVFVATPLTVEPAAEAGRGGPPGRGGVGGRGGTGCTGLGGTQSSRPNGRSGPDGQSGANGRDGTIEVRLVNFATVQSTIADVLKSENLSTSDLETNVRAVLNGLDR